MKPVFRRIVFRGFTLIELAIVLVIISLMTGFGMKALQSDKGGNTKCYDETRAQLRKISGAIDNYVRAHGFYPKPAMVSAGVTHTTFGTAATSTANISQESGNLVWFGALPFSALGLTASYAADCWGNKFIYVVTQELSNNPAAYQSGTGRITVKTGTLASSTNITTIAAYAVISRGENALSPCQRNYTGSISNCFCNAAQANVGITRIDKENCDTNNTTLFSTAFNNGPNAPNYFDDLIIYKEKAASTNAGCVPTDIAWNTNCSAPVGALGHGASTNVTNATSGYTGSATISCNAGELTASSATCDAAASNCTLPWGGTINSGQSVTAYASATPAGACSSENRTCTNGTLSGSYTAQSCTAGCAAAGQTWLTNCGATANAAVAGAAQGLTNTNGGYSGSATATCNAGGSGSFALSSTSCSATSCTLPWGGSIANSASVTAYLSASPTGACTSESRTCNSGTLSGTYTNQSCTAGCAATSKSWGSGCSATTTAAAAGAAQGLTNSASGYGGSATATCNAGGSGAFALSSTSCSEVCTLPWGGTINAGASVTAYEATAPVGTCNGETRDCVAGASCAAATVNWTDETNCSKATSGTLAHNATQALSVSTTLKEGYCVARCNNGVLSCDSGYYCYNTGSSSCSTC